jgi:plasmid stabilization system protein ParE
MGKIVWNKRAINELYAVISYLLEQDANQAAVNFNEKTKAEIEKLQDNRMGGRKSPNAKTIHFVLLGKNHRLYYRKIGSTVRIVSITDTRQDPAKRKY